MLAFCNIKLQKHLNTLQNLCIWKFHLIINQQFPDPSFKSSSSIHSYLTHLPRNSESITLNFNRVHIVTQPSWCLSLSFSPRLDSSRDE